MTLEHANATRDKLRALLALEDTQPEEFNARIGEIVPLALDCHDTLIELKNVYAAFSVLLLAVHENLPWDDKCVLSNTIAETVDAYDTRFFNMRYYQQQADYVLGAGNE